MGLPRVLWIGPAHGLPPGWPAYNAVCQIDFESPLTATAALARAGYAAILLDRTGSDLLPQVHRIAPRVPVLIHDPAASVSDAVRLAHSGAHHVLTSTKETFDKIQEAVADYQHSVTEPAGRPVSLDWERLLVGKAGSCDPSIASSAWWPPAVPRS